MGARRPKVVDSVPRQGHVVVEASAGTGKTYFVEHLYVDRIVGGATVDQVLVVTFTEKAAREMRSRIRARLLSVLAEAEGSGGEAETTAGGWRLDLAALRRLRAAAQAIDRAPISTIHAFCLQVLSERPLEAAVPVTLRAVEGGRLARGAVLQVLRRALGGSLLNHAQRDVLLGWLSEEGGLEGVVRVVRAWLSEEGRRFDAIVPERVAERAEVAVRLVEAAREVIDRRLRDEGLVDFDGMVRAVDEALQASGSELLARLRARYRHGLVDEFQDTSPRQWRIFRAIFLDRPLEDGATLTVVGDPKQAIYGFRGGDLFTYLEAREALLGAHGAVPLRLERTFRSGEGLAKAFGFLFGPLAEAEGADIFGHPQVRYVPVESGHPMRRLRGPEGRPLPPLHLLCLGGRRGSSVPHKDRGRGAERKRSPDRFPADALGRGHLEAIARLLHAWFVLGPPPLLEGHGEERSLRRRDVFVLCRTRGEALEAVEAIRRAGVAAALYKQQGLYRGEEAWALRALLRALAEPTDPGARAAAWLTPYFGLSPEELASEEEEGRIGRLHAWARLAEGRRWPELVGDWERSGLVERQLALAPTERRLANLRALHEQVLLWGARGLGLAEMLSRLEALGRGEALEEDVGGEGLERLPSEADAVQVMTIHASKGLEAEVVFLYGGRGTGRIEPMAPVAFSDAGGKVRRVAWGCPTKEEAKRGRVRPLPGAGKPAPGEPQDATALRRAIEWEQRGEAARLAYVAMTRARRMLVLPYAPALFGDAGEEALREERLVATPEGRAVAEQLGIEDSDWVPLPQACLPVPGHGSLAEVVAVRLRALLADPAFLDARGTLWASWAAWVVPREASESAAEACRRLERAESYLLRFASQESREELGAVASERVPWRAAELLAATAPVEGASFTRLQRQTTGGDGDVTLSWCLDEEGVAPADLRGGGVRRLDSLEAAEEPELVEGMPGGRAAGVALHELVEWLDWDAVRSARDFVEWWDRLRGEPTFAAWSAEHRPPLGESGLEALGRVLFAALRAPVEVGALRLQEGLCALPESARAVEREFRLWVPAGASGAPVLLEGVVDLIFEHDGRLYLLDWKSNRLPEWTAGRVASYVRTHYAGQVALYTLGLAASSPSGPPWSEGAESWEARFGGVLYAFVRGMAGGEPGALWFHRPAPALLERWWRVLRERPMAQWLPAIEAAMEEVCR